MNKTEEQFNEFSSDVMTVFLNENNSSTKYNFNELLNIN